MYNIDKIPTGWAKAKISDLFDFVGGGTPSKKEFRFWNGDIPWASVKDIKGSYLNETQDTITQVGLENSAANIANPGEVILITRISPGKVITTKIRTAINQDLKIVRPKYNANPDFIRYLFNTLEKECIKLSSGTTVLGITLDLLNEIDIIIPPLNEQNRIVLKLDELLSELEKGKEQLQTSLAQLKVYRQSILKYAFEGKFTNDYILDGQMPDSWKYKSIEEISSVLGDGLHGTPKYSDNGEYYFINGNNLSDGIIEIKSNTKRVPKSEYEKYKKPLNQNTVFVSINGSIGYTAFYNNENVILGKSACYFNIIEGVNKYYVRCYLKSNHFIAYANKEATGSTIKNLGLRAMRDFQIPFPPTIEEQNRIVQEIEKQFSICQNLEEILIGRLEIAEGLKKSILSNAFEGKLVEQNPNDEPSSVLLDKIKIERAEYLKAEKERKKIEIPLHLKSRKMAEELKNIIEILKESKEPVAAKTLWQSSKYKDDIDNFYAALKTHIESGEIIEMPRKGKESFLKLADAK